VLLDSTDLSIEVIAGRCGFTTTTSLREHFARRVATTPSAYRRAFRTATSETLPVH
jgi:transcriptional regulator GlxA family with amidase domain